MYREKNQVIFPSSYPTLITRSFWFLKFSVGWCGCNTLKVYHDVINHNTNITVTSSTSHTILHVLIRWWWRWRWCRQQVLCVSTSAFSFLHINNFVHKYPRMLYYLSFLDRFIMPLLSQLRLTYTHTPSFILLPQTVWYQSEVRNPTARPKLNESRFSVCVRVR